jgi:hypothetical protein
VQREGAPFYVGCGDRFGGIGGLERSFFIGVDHAHSVVEHCCKVLKRVHRSSAKDSWTVSSIVVGRRAARTGDGGPVRVGKGLVDKADGLCGMVCGTDAEFPATVHSP